jgi:hypothetical protein
MEFTYYTDGYHFRRVINQNSFIQVFPEKWGPAIDVRNYKTGITDSFDANWKPCNQDEFVAAYCTTINLISAASGIEHLPLVMEPNFLTESNQES